MIAWLLDTHALLWALGDDERLAPWVSRDIGRDATRFGISYASRWEIAAKRANGKLRVPQDLPRIVDESGFARVANTRFQVWAVGDLPLHHRDPFDRLLVAQARDLSVPIVTADKAVAAYDVPVAW